MRRRKFIKNGSAFFSAILGINIVYSLPKGYKPLFLSQDPYTLFGKHKDMVILNDRPWNVEAQAHILDDLVTPKEKMFIRNNGIIPKPSDIDKWILQIDGESVSKPKLYTIQEIKQNFPVYTYQLTLECGGNGRAEFDPPAKGNQWTVGAISCAKWTGVRLRDVLQDVGIKNDAVYVGYYGRDIHLSKDTKKYPISRGVPLNKARQTETLIAFAMNGEDIPIEHGHPLRLVAGGWPASASGKWIHRLSIRNKVHDGAKMLGQSYRVPCKNIEPGMAVTDDEMCIIESMPVKSLITYPQSGAIIKPGQLLEIRGHAWAGELEVKQVDYSLNFGATWHACNLDKPVNRLAWQHFKAKITPNQSGYYEIWVRAKDEKGVMQPMVLPGWNPRGYLNNACHRIAIKVI